MEIWSFSNSLFLLAEMAERQYEESSSGSEQSPRRSWAADKKSDESLTPSERVRITIRRGGIVDPKEFMLKVAADPKVKERELADLISAQYVVARHCENWAWVEKMQREATVIFSPSWIVEHIPHKQSWKNIKTKVSRPFGRYAGDMGSSTMAKDVRENVTVHRFEGVMEREQSADSEEIIRPHQFMEVFHSSRRDTRPRQKTVKRRYEHESEWRTTSGQTRGNIHTQTFYRSDESKKCPEDLRITLRKDRKIKVAKRPRGPSRRDESPQPAKKRMVAKEETSRLKGVRKVAQTSREVSRRKTQCIVKGCPTLSSKLKWHAYYHLPDCCRIVCGEIPSKELTRKRANCLRRLAKLVVGKLGNLNDLLKLVNETWRGSAFRTEDITVSMEELADLLKVATPTEVSQPITSPAALLHWKVMCHLLNFLSVKDQQAFGHYDGIEHPEGETVTIDVEAEQVVEPETLPKENKGEVEEMEVTTIQSQSECQSEEMDSAEERRLLGLDEPKPQRLPKEKRKEISKEETQPSGKETYAEVVQKAVSTRGQSPKSKPELGTTVRSSTADGRKLEAFDSHFHLDRLLLAEKKPRGLSVEGAIKLPVGRPPKVEVEVIGGVLNYCDPETLGKRSYPLDPRWRVAVGIHPKKVDLMTPDKWVEFEKEIHSSRIAAISEIGLDFSAPTDTWVKQTDVLERILRMGATGLVLVVHLRGAKGDPLGKKVHDRCLQAFKTHCSPYQRIHLHTYTGDYVVKCFVVVSLFIVVFL